MNLPLDKIAYHCIVLTYVIGFAAALTLDDTATLMKIIDLKKD